MSDLRTLMGVDTPAELTPDQIKFNTGDIVLLKSGSVPMVVGQSSGLKTIECVWMTPSGELHTKGFFPALLEHAADNEQHTLQQKMTLLNLKLNLKKLEGFENDLQKKTIGLSSPGMGMPRKRR